MRNEGYRTGPAVAFMDDRGNMGRFAFGALLLRTLRRRPRDSIGVVVAAIAAGAIVINALWLQPSAHPAPIFPTSWRPVSSSDTTGSVAPMVPRPRPAELAAPKAEVPVALRTKAQIVSDIQRELARRKFYEGPVDGVYGAKTDAAIRDFEHAAGLKASVEPDETLLRTIARSAVQAPPAPPAAAPKRNASTSPTAASSKRVVAVQRALADFGYGQVAPTGIGDPATKTAIERFERERKLPVTGQVSDRLVRELAAMTGRPLE